MAGGGLNTAREAGAGLLGTAGIEEVIAADGQFVGMVARNISGDIPEEEWAAKPPTAMEGEEEEEP